MAKFVTVSNRNSAWFKKTQVNVTDDTTRIHLSHHPSKQALQTLIEKAPNLKVLQIPRSRLDKLSDEHMAMLAEAGVEVEVGNPVVTRKGKAGPFYRKHRRYFRNLKGKRKEMFDELIRYNILSALIVARYFCLSGEEYLPEAEIAIMYGYKNDSTGHQISMHVNAVLHYLNPQHKVGERTMKKYRSIVREVKDWRTSYKYRSILLQLTASQQRLFDQLVSQNIESAFIVKQCFLGKEAQAMHAFAKSHGYRSDRLMIHIDAVMHYLDPNLEVSERSLMKCRAICRQVSGPNLEPHT